MKHKGLLLSMVLFLFGMIQSVSANNMPDSYFYGVDFSLSHVIGASETPDQFKNAFIGINDLFVREPDKYNLSKFLNRNVCQQDVKPALESIDKMNMDNLFNATGCLDAALLNEQLQKLISGYSFPQNEGTGILIVADVLDKPTHMASFYLCIFDLATKELIKVSEGTGKAKGFGLRNYWAGSVYSFLKDQKKNFK